MPKMAHTNASLFSVLAEIANAYPTEEVRAAQVKDVRRIAFHIDLVRQLAGPKVKVVAELRFCGVTDRTLAWRAGENSNCPQQI
jgi:hypothetical protein